MELPWLDDGMELRCGNSLGSEKLSTATAIQCVGARQLSSLASGELWFSKHCTRNADANGLMYYGYLEDLLRFSGFVWPEFFEYLITITSSPRCLVSLGRSRNQSGKKAK